MKVLVIVEFIAPVNAVASIRWTKLSKYLKKNHGYEIDLLTNAKCYDGKSIFKTQYKYDETLARDLPIFGRVYEIAATPMLALTNLVRNTAKALHDRQVKQSHKTKQRKKGGITDAPDVSRNTSMVPRQSKLDVLSDIYQKLREKSLVKQISRMPIIWSDYDVIISSFGPKWVHLAAREIKLKNPDIVWIADYRDALAYSERTSTEENINFGREFTSEADCVTLVSPLPCFHLALKEGQRWETIPNGYDGEESSARARIPSSKFLISYTGTLNNDKEAHRDITPILNALSELTSEGKVDPSDIELVYCGQSESEFLRQINDYDALPWVNKGMVSRAESLDLQSASSLLILCTWNTEYAQGVVTGKIFEYLSAGVPIVTICSGNIPGSLSKEMMEKSNAGICYEESMDQRDFPLLKNYILRQYLIWKESGMTTYDPNLEYIASFDHKNLSSQVKDIIESLVSSEHAYELKQTRNAI